MSFGWPGRNSIIAEQAYFDEIPDLNLSWNLAELILFPELWLQ